MTNTSHTSHTSPTSPPTTGSPPTGGKDTSDQAREEARKTAETGKRKASDVVDEAKSQTTQLARTAGEEARERADGELDKLAGALGRVGDELDEMADGSKHPDGYITALARDGARTANQWSDRLQSGGLDGALDEVKSFARRRPATFLAATLGVGLAIGRVSRNADMQAIKPESNGSDGSNGSDAPQGVGRTEGYVGSTGPPGTTGTAGAGQPISTGGRRSP